MRNTESIYTDSHELFPSLERVQQYLVIEQEPKPTEAGVPPAYWPGSGNLKVEKLSARYSEVTLISRWMTVQADVHMQDGPDVLHDISFEAKSGERIGIGTYDADFRCLLS